MKRNLNPDAPHARIPGTNECRDCGARLPSIKEAGVKE